MISMLTTKKELTQCSPAAFQLMQSEGLEVVARLDTFAQSQVGARIPLSLEVLDVLCPSSSPSSFSSFTFLDGPHRSIPSIDRVRSVLFQDRPSVMNKHLISVCRGYVLLSSFFLLIASYFASNHGRTDLCKWNVIKCIPLLIEHNIIKYTQTYFLLFLPSLSFVDFLNFVAEGEDTGLQTSPSAGGLRQLVAALRYLTSPGCLTHLDVGDCLFELSATYFKHGPFHHGRYQAYLLEHMFELLLNARKDWTRSELERIHRLSVKNKMPPLCQQRVLNQIAKVDQQLLRFA